MKTRQISAATRYILTVCLMLLALNAVLGILLIRQSGSSMKNMIRRHMISVAETASAMIDGDALAALTADDAGSEAYNRILRTLRTIQDAQMDTDIKYIYIVRREEDRYVFTVDSDPVDPAAFGAPVVATPMQDLAWFGAAQIDPEPIEDEWGCYYTSWCSVKDSAGNVVGMVGLDFAADWYDQQMKIHTITVVVVCGLSLLASALIMVLLSWQHYRRFQQLDGELSTLTDNVEDFARAVIQDCPEGADASRARLELNSDTDMVRQFSERIHATQGRLSDYMRRLEKQAFTDSMTSAGNKDAYLNRIQRLSAEIDAGTAAFAVAIFDVNGLKYINDNYGHQCGDRIIIDTAMLIRRVFDREDIYRIGGDEFIAVLNGTGVEELGAGFDRLRGEVERFNREEKRYAMALSLSCGGTVYLPGEDASFKEVFRRADMAMYRDKETYYRRLGLRPRHYVDLVEQ